MIQAEHTVPCGHSCRRTPECWAFYMRMYWAKNGERMRALQRKSLRKRMANSETRAKYNARRRVWYAANREDRNEKQRQMKAANREHYRAYRNLRWATSERAVRSGLPPVDASWVLVLKSDPCSYCGGPGGELDHITPLTKGGQHVWDNLAAACKSCNSAKYNRDILHLYRLRQEVACLP